MTCVWVLGGRGGGGVSLKTGWCHGPTPLSVNYSSEAECGGSRGILSSGRRGFKASPSVSLGLTFPLLGMNQRMIKKSTSPLARANEQNRSS